MAKYLNPKTDVTFKKVFGEHKDLLISFLNAMLPLPEDNPVVSLEYLQPELVPNTPTKKDSIVDVRCTDKIGRQFIVEMQMYWTNAFIKRATLNACKAYSMPTEKGELYKSLKPVYTLSLINDTAFTQHKDYYHCYKMTDQKYTDETFDELIMVFIELTKFVPDNTEEKKMQVLWLRYLTEIDEKTKTAPEPLLKDKDVSKALELLEESAYTDGELLTIDRYWDAVSRERTLLDDRYEKGIAKGLAKGLAKGREEGHAKGLAKGREEGLAKGIVQGREEGIELGKRDEAFAIALSLKAKGIPLSVISECTGLSISELETL